MAAKVKQQIQRIQVNALIRQFPSRAAAGSRCAEKVASTPNAAHSQPLRPVSPRLHPLAAEIDTDNPVDVTAKTAQARTAALRRVGGIFSSSTMGASITRPPAYRRHHRQARITVCRKFLIPFMNDEVGY